MLLLLAALCAASISKGLSFSISSRTAELKLPEKFGRLYRLEATARIKKEDAQAPKRAAKKSKDDRDVFLELITEKLLQKMEYFETHGTGPPEDDEDRSASLSDDQTKLLNGVVRIYCTHSQPNFGMPWQRMKQEFSTSTGFVIDGRRILTNAHAVEYGSLIQVKKRSSEKKYVASVIAVGHECDLAMLQIDDVTFWEGLEPLTFGPIPDLLEDVSVIGYPVGGDSISISSGVVSRIEMQEYAQASADLLAIQIDAAVNPGNSGGPVVNSANQVIGVAFQSLSDEDIENIGYVVPVNVIFHFLDDVEKHGRYSGVCGLGVRLQPMENDRLRKHFGMTEDDTGVLVLSTAATSPASSLLKKGDVLLSVDKIRIANDGTIPFREGTFKERVQLSYYFTQRFSSDKVKLELLRDGSRISITVALWIPQRLVPRTLLQKNYINAATNTGTGSNGSIVGGVPSYLIVGGLVMLSLSKEYLDTEFHTEHMQDVIGWAEEFRILSLSDSMQREQEEEVVMLSQVIAHSCNIGYEMNKNLHLKSLNNIPIKNLKQLKSILDQYEIQKSDILENTKSSKTSLKSKISKTKSKIVKNSDSVEKEVENGLDVLLTSKALVFEFTNDQVVVLDAIEAFDAKEQICREHFIPHHCSIDLMQP